MLVLVPAAVYGVARLAIWYSVKDAFDNVRNSMSPVAAVEYSKILSPVFGAFGITGVRIQPHIFEDEISIGSALVHIQDPIEKYHFLSATMDDRIPTSFNFSLNGIQVPLDGDLASWFDRGVAPSGTPAGAPAGCSLGSPFSVSDMKSMGYEELLANIELDYSYDRIAGGLSTYVKINLHEMFELVLEGQVPASEVVFAVDRIKGVPKLSDFSISIRDLSWSSRFNSYCAKAMGITEAQYTQRRLTETREALSAGGFRPSDALMKALETFAEGTGQLTLSLNPREPLDPTSVSFSEDPEFLIDRLGLEVLVDGKPVPELGTVVQEVAETEEEEQQKPVDETYKPTPVPELPQYLKSHVQIFTSDGKVHEGYLDGVDQQKIILTRHLVGGSVTFDVNRTDVNKVLVLRP